MFAAHENCLSFGQTQSGLGAAFEIETFDKESSEIETYDIEQSGAGGSGMSGTVTYDTKLSDSSMSGSETFDTKPSDSGMSEIETFDNETFDIETFDTESFDIETFDNELDDEEALSSFDDDAGGSVSDGGRGFALTPEDALVMSMNRYGEVRVEYMAKLAGKDADTLMRELWEAHAVWPDPHGYDPDCAARTKWLTKNMYARGNIYGLLKEAKEMEKKYPGVFKENIRMLKAVLPESPDAEDIRISLGAMWVPPSYYVNFIRELLGTGENPEVVVSGYLGKWIIRCGDPDWILNRYAYGTRRMSAVEILEHTMNAQEIKVTDPVRNCSTGKTEYVVNHHDTLEAQEKQRAILKAFQEWLRKVPGRRVRLAELYSRRFGYRVQTYDGSWLRLEDAAEDISFYPYQKDAVARCIMSGNTLLAHKVGSGKTYEMICSVHELHRMGLISKGMVVVPNNIFDAFVQDHRRLYPQDEILAVYPKSFTVAGRKEILDRIRRGGYVAVYMAYSSFDMLKMSRQYYLDLKQKEIFQCAEEIRKAHNRVEKNALEAKHGRLNKQYEKLREKLKDTDESCFDKLGIDLLILDECQNYKNVTVKGTAENIVGFHTTGSRKCDAMLEKVRFVQNSGGRIIFATGTPLTNSLTDLYVLQLYLQPEDLKSCGIEYFSEWITVFGEMDEAFEIDVDGQNFRVRSRYSRFHNLPELMALFSSVCDFYQVSDDNRLPVFRGYTDVLIKRNELQRMFIEDIGRRTEEIHLGQADRKKDNLLLVTVDGRKCALDMRLVDPEFWEESEEESRIDACAAKVFENYVKYPGTSQIVFCDSSTPKKTFNIYDELKNVLVKKGAAPEDVVFIHEGTTEQKRRKLLEDMNSGKIRIMLGSTQKLGTGVNVQRNLLAVHHLDIPWRPSDVVQREGRLIRQGNQNPEVFIYRYITEGSFDSYSWQILENKQKFISSFLEGTMDEVHRSESDIADTVLSYAEAKALAIGNPLIRKRVEVSNHLERLRIAQKQRRRQLLELRSMESSLCEEIQKREETIRLTKKDLDFCLVHRERVPEEERTAFGEELLEALKDNDSRPSERFFAEYQGFKVLLPARMDPQRPHIILTRQKDGRNYTVQMGDARTAGVSRRIDYVLTHLPETLRRHEKKLRALRRQLLEVREELKKGNAYDAQTEAVMNELDAIDEELRC